MKLTTTFLNEKFKEFNKAYFSNSLETPYITIGHSKRINGQYQREYFMGVLINKIMISGYWERSEHEICTTLLHEMIHQYIAQNRIRDNKIHGRKFMEIAERINQYGWDIAAKGHLEKHIPNKEEKCYMLAFKWIDGSYNLTRYNKNYEFRLTSTLARNGAEYFLFTTKEPKYARFRVCRTLRAVGITKEEYFNIKDKHNVRIAI